MGKFFAVVAVLGAVFAAGWYVNGNRSTVHTTICDKSGELLSQH